MSEVQKWDPTLHVLGCSDRKLLNQVATQVSVDRLALTDQQLKSLQTIDGVAQRAWLAFAMDKRDEELVNWIKVLTLCPELYSGFVQGASSPVIPLVRVLRRRGTFSPDLRTWIKQHSRNRFLPYGSVADRLG